MKNSFAGFSPSVKKIQPFTHTLSAPSAQLAIYDSLLSPPRVERIQAESIREFLDILSVRTYEAVKSQGSTVPFVVIREIIENLIHADFKETVISILENGNKICVSDQGNGIPDKEKALQPGFTTALKWQKAFIRGVGSGFAVANELIHSSGGTIKIEDNLNNGTVITLLLKDVCDAMKDTHSKEAEEEVNLSACNAQADAFSSELARTLRESFTEEKKHEEGNAQPDEARTLSTREKKALLVLAELGQAGPSQIAKELQMSVPTAHRELAFLEKYGLATRVRGGKRALSEKGTKYLQRIFWEADGT